MQEEPEVEYVEEEGESNEDGEEVEYVEEEVEVTDDGEEEEEEVEVTDDGEEEEEEEDSQTKKAVPAAAAKKAPAAGISKVKQVVVVWEE